MDKAGQAQAAYVRIADKAAKLYTPVVHSLALITFMVWIILGGAVWQDALMIAVTVLIITCPCALGLAVPVVQVLATGKLMKQGVFVKSGDALERLASVDVAVFDKTGTLTLGKPVLIEGGDEETLRLAASLAAHSRHPLSVAVTRACDRELLSLHDVEEHGGQGLSGVYDGQQIKLGSRAFCGDENVAKAQGPEIWLCIDCAPPTRFQFEDSLRVDASQTIKQMQDASLETFLVSGDRDSVVQNVAGQVGIKSVYAEQSPVQKYEIIERLQGEGHSVLMVGDGLNDAPVLAAANVSMAPGTAIDVAQNAADIVFMGDALDPVYKTYAVAKKTQSLVKQNFTLAVLYNLVAVPLAVAGFVTPFIAALAMSGSSLLVIANSFRLKLSS